MQSGISVSQELKEAFNALVSASNQRGLIAAIESESIKPLHQFPSQSSDFFEDLSVLQSLLSETKAAYVILKRYQDSPDGFVAVTFVPDAAPVRQKMLFAATRLSLVRELGEGRFRDKLFVTELKDLTKEGWQRHEASGASSAPLTAEEESLQGIKEAEATERGGTEGKRLETGGKLSMPMSNEAHEALSGLKGAPGGTLIQLYINVKTESIELASQTQTSGSQLTSAISDSGPRYSLFKQGTGNSLVFIYSCPGGLGVKDRMLHAGSKRGFLVALEKDLGLSISKKFEVSSPSEIEDPTLSDEAAPVVEQKPGFSRPKKPGRR